MDPIQSQLLLITSERFGLLLAENMNEVGVPLTVQADNICKSYMRNLIQSLKTVQ